MQINKNLNVKIAKFASNLTRTLGSLGITNKNNRFQEMLDMLRLVEILGVC